MKLKLKRFFQKITVEPCIFMYAISECLRSPANAEFLYKRTCASQFPDDEHDLCNNLKNESFAAEENIVQAAYSRLEFYGDLCNIAPLFLGFLYGIICDKYSRKIVMAIPIIGIILQTIFFIIMALKPEIPIMCFLVGRAFTGLAGGWPTFFMAIMSYIAYVTDTKERTTRIAIANGTLSLGYIISYFFSGIILDATGFIFTSVITIVCDVVGLLAIFFLKHEHAKLEESGNKSSEKSEKQSATKENELDSASNDEKKTCPANMLWTLKQLVRKRPRNGRMHLILNLCTMFFIVFGTVPFYQQMYVFTKKQPLSWSQSMYGYFKSSHNVASIIGMFVALPILKKFKVKDTYLLMAACASYTGAYLMTAWTKTSWIIFIGGQVAFFGDNAYNCCRAMISYILEPNELGKIFAVIAMVQGVSGLVASSAFNLIYAEYLEVLWPGFVFMLGAIILLIPIGITIYLHFNMTKMGLFEHLEATQAEKSKGEQNMTDRQMDENEVNTSLI